ncbi:MAG: AMP-binding protein, partial [bacterium]|nr:AMP-binding protein [bacterium]
NQNYPHETLLYQLNNFFFQEEFSIFDIAVLLENIHEKSYLNTVKPNMIFRFKRLDESVRISVDYNTMLFDDASIASIAAHFQYLLNQVLFDLAKPLKEITIVSEEERKQLIYEFNETAMEYPGEQTLNRIFEEQVEKNSAKIAVEYEGETITYGELNEKANQMAHYLIEKGHTPGTITAVITERTIGMVVAILGIIKAGGAYLPIDPNYPGERIKYMLNDSNVERLFTRGKPGDDYGVKETIDLDEPLPGHLESDNPENINHAESLLYVIYTSGSTGTPKGVMVGHRSFVNLIYTRRKIFNGDHRDRMSQVAGLSFDAMAFEIWPCLCNGATLCIANEETQVDPALMKEWLIDSRITISYQPTIMAELLLKEQWPREKVALKLLLTAGDTLTRSPDKRHPFKLYNLYGPTEATVWTTWAEIPPGSKLQKRPSIGVPISNTKVYILAPDLSLMPRGAVGELCIAG